MPPSPTQPLAGIRVLDAADEKGEFCGRLLADLGAEVTRLEPPGGGISRGLGPFAAAPSGRTSLYFGLRNAGKRGITLALEKPAGRELLHRLLERMDVFLESSQPGWLEQHELAPAQLLERHPRLVMTSVTDFGRDGAYRDYQGTSMIGFAMGGMMHRSGAADRPPCNAPGHLAYDSAGLCAAFPTLMALYQRMRGGAGQHIDCSVHESVAAMADWSIPNGSIGGAIVARNGAGMYPLYRCLDGYVRMIILTTGHWRTLLEWMDHPPELADSKYDQFLERLMNMALINEKIGAFFGTRKKLEICVEGQRRGLPVTPLLEPSQVIDNEHTRARGTFAQVELEPEFPITLPSGFLHLDETRTGPAAGPPALGQHNAELFGGELGLGSAELDRLRADGVI